MLLNEEVNVQLLLSHLIEFEVNHADVLVKIIQYVLQHFLLLLNVARLYLLQLDQSNLMLVPEDADVLSVDPRRNHVVLSLQVVDFHTDEVLRIFDVLEVALQTPLALGVYRLVCAYLLFDLLDHFLQTLTALVQLERLESCLIVDQLEWRGGLGLQGKHRLLVRHHDVLVGSV